MERNSGIHSAFSEPPYEGVLKKYTAQLQKNREFLLRVWNLDNDERPGFIVIPDPRTSPSAQAESGNFCDRLLDKEKHLQSQVTGNEVILQTRSDFVPFLTPNIGVVAIPSALGSEIQWWENDWPVVRPAISDPAQIYQLQKPNLTDGVMGMELEMMRHWLDRTGGKYPIAMADCQSPMDIASMLLGQNNFMLALYSHPKEIHHLLTLVTEVVIEFIQAQRDLVHRYQAEFVGTIDQPWIPDGFGVNIAHDDNILISPTMHDEFAVPYLNRISEAFNGIFLHSCGRFSHNLKSFEKIHQLRGLEFGASEAPYHPVLDYFNGRIVLAMRIGLNREIKFESMADFIRSVRRASKTNRGLFLNIQCAASDMIAPENWSDVGLQEIYDLVERQGVDK